MSTKIYNGLKIKLKIKTVNDVIKLHNFIKNKIKNKTKDYIIKELTNKYIRERYFNYDNLNSDEIFNDIINDFLEEISDFTSTLTIIKNNKEYFGYYTPIDSFFYNEIIKDKKKFKDYSYFNNTEKPDDVTNREWKKRKNDWIDIIKKTKTWNIYQMGIRFTFTYDNVENLIDNIIKLINNENILNALRKRVFINNKKGDLFDNIEIYLNEFNSLSNNELKELDIRILENIKIDFLPNKKNIKNNNNKLNLYYIKNVNKNEDIFNLIENEKTEIKNLFFEYNDLKNIDLVVYKDNENYKIGYYTNKKFKNKNIEKCNYEIICLHNFGRIQMLHF